MAQKIILIAAIGKNRELGRGSELVWRLSGDLKQFKEITVGFPVIMGRKTYESIGKALPNRVNIIVTKNPEFRAENCVVVSSLEQALETARNTGAEKMFVIGGGEIYKSALPYATELNLTLVEAEDPSADVFFPEFENDFEKIAESEPQEENGVRFSFAEYRRAQPHYDIS